MYTYQNLLETDVRRIWSVCAGKCLRTWKEKLSRCDCQWAIWSFTWVPWVRFFFLHGLSYGKAPGDTHHSAEMPTWGACDYDMCDGCKAKASRGVGDSIWGRRLLMAVFGWCKHGWVYVRIPISNDYCESFMVMSRDLPKWSYLRNLEVGEFWCYPDISKRTNLEIQND